MRPLLESNGFAEAVLDALVAQLCVVDREGVIILVNRAWMRFKSENSTGPVRSDVGTQYLSICLSAASQDCEEGGPFAAGLHSVLKGEINLFELEYPCHSPTEQRWYLGRIASLGRDRGGAVISHLNITDRKLVEIQLARLAATDSLTGLPNRRSFQESANRELGRVRRLGPSACVIMLDVDHFKVLNDTYGHALGDEAIRFMAETCKRALRGTDVLARYGGEEFVILLPGTTETQALQVADKLRGAICRSPITFDEHEVTLTASFGVAGIQASDMDIEDAVARADVALYAAKHAGRNCVMRYNRVQHPPKKKIA